MPIKKYRAWIIAALVLAASSVIIEGSSTFQQCMHDTKNKEGEYATQEGVAKIAKIYSIRRDCIGTFIHKNGEAITALFTVVLAISTIGLWSSTRNLWSATVDAANRQEKDTEILQRAYLSVEPGGIHRFLDNSERFSCEVVIHNAGNLPAKNVAWFIDRAADASNERKNFEIGVLEGRILLVAKGRSRKSGRYLNTTDLLQITDLDSGKTERWLYVWGRVNYEDGFGEERHTLFCHRYHLGALNISKGIDAHAGRYHQHGNDAN
jgi:hypothetical protein